MSAQHYKKLATFLWLCFGGLAGLTAGVYLAWNNRALLFAMILGAGIVILLRVNWPKQQQTPIIDAQGKNSVVDVLLAHNEPLSGEKARAFLDKLLVQQQLD